MLLSWFLDLHRKHRTISPYLEKNGACFLDSQPSYPPSPFPPHRPHLTTLPLRQGVGEPPGGRERSRELTPRQGGWGRERSREPGPPPWGVGVGSRLRTRTLRGREDFEVVTSRLQSRELFFSRLQSREVHDFKS